MPLATPLTHIFIDHSNMWGGARAASRLKDPREPELSTRIRIWRLDQILGGKQVGVSTKIVSGGIPPGMEGVWTEYQKQGDDTQRLIRDDHWKELGVDHTIIGHMWKLLAMHRESPTRLVLASGDGKQNEFNTSFIEVLRGVLTHDRYESWQVHLASFDWEYPNAQKVRSPTSTKMKTLIDQSDRGMFINLTDHYDKVVFHKAWTPMKPKTVEPRVAADAATRALAAPLNPDVRCRSISTTVGAER